MSARQVAQSVLEPFRPDAANPIERQKHIHQDIIDGILKDWPDAKTRGFMPALKTLPDAEYTPWLMASQPEWAAWIKIVPDAYLIVPDKRHVVMFEAVHGHDVSAKKFAKMNDLSWALDEDCYRLILIRCDRWGRTAYDVRGASVCSDIELLAAGLKPDPAWRVPDWHRYTYEYVAAFLPRDRTQAMDKEPLLPCPFCGSAGVVRQEVLSPRWFYPTCTGGDCPGVVDEQDEQGGTCCSVKTQDEAIALWNTRAQTSGGGK